MLISFSYYWNSKVAEQTNLAAQAKSQRLFWKEKCVHKKLALHFKSRPFFGLFKWAHGKKKVGEPESEVGESFKEDKAIVKVLILNQSLLI